MKTTSTILLGFAAMFASMWFAQRDPGWCPSIAFVAGLATWFVGVCGFSLERIATKEESEARVRQIRSFCKGDQ